MWSNNFPFYWNWRSLFTSVVEQDDSFFPSTTPPQTNNHENRSVYAPDETRGVVEYINNLKALSQDPLLSDKLPINPNSNDLYTKAIQDGLLLGRIAELVEPSVGSVVVKMIKKEYLNYLEKINNVSICLNVIRKIPGIQVVNIGASDIVDGKEDLILGLLWQLIRHHLLNRVSLTSHPELLRVLKENDYEHHSYVNPTSSTRPEWLLMQWFNYHLKKANHPRMISNFHRDLRDSENYLVLLNRLCDNINNEIIHEPNLEKRASLMLEEARKLDKLLFPIFIKPQDIVSGNEKANLAFVAYLFDNYSGLVSLSSQEILELQIENKRLSKEVKSLQAQIENLKFANDLTKKQKKGVLERAGAKIDKPLVNILKHLSPQSSPALEERKKKKKEKRDEKRRKLESKLQDLKLKNLEYRAQRRLLTTRKRETNT